MVCYKRTKKRIKPLTRDHDTLFTSIDHNQMIDYFTWRPTGPLITIPDVDSILHVTGRQHLSLNVSDCPENCSQCNNKKSVPHTVTYIKRKTQSHTLWWQLIRVYWEVMMGRKSQSQRENAFWLVQRVKNFAQRRLHPSFFRGSWFYCVAAVQETSKVTPLLIMRRISFFVHWGDTGCNQMQRKRQRDQTPMINFRVQLHPTNHSLQIATHIQYSPFLSSRASAEDNLSLHTRNKIEDHIL